MDTLITPLFHISSQLRPIPVGSEALNSLLSPDMVTKYSAMIVMKEFLPELDRVLFHKAKNLTYRS